MDKNVKLFYLLTFVMTVVVVAWNTLTNFFGGTGINFVAMLVMLAILISMVVSNKELLKKVKDLFIVDCALTALETIVFIPNEFGGCKNYNVAVVFFNFQNVFTFLGLIFLCWLLFRFLTDYKNVKIHFVEVMLGNEKRTKKPKKEKQAKEVSNGSLSKKPNSIEAEEDVQDAENEESTEVDESEEV